MSYEYSWLARDLSGTVQSSVGTPAYLAPEVRMWHMYDSQDQILSLSLR